MSQNESKQPLFESTIDTKTRASRQNLSDSQYLVYIITMMCGKLHQDQVGPVVNKVNRYGPGGVEGDLNVRSFDIYLCIIIRSEE